MKRIAWAVLVLLIACGLQAASNTEMCPMHEEHKAGNKGESRADGHAEHGAEVDGRHDTLGMSHETSTHSFRLLSDGGAIELKANGAEDLETVRGVRTHLAEIVAQFSENEFSTPEFVHGYPPDGVERMKRLGDAISYDFEELARGGRVRITTSSPEAREAVHEFLKFQIVEHRTADSGLIEAALEP